MHFSDLLELYHVFNEQFYCISLELLFKKIYWYNTVSYLYSLSQDIELKICGKKTPFTITTMKVIRKIKPFFVDKRGEMSHLLENEEPITSAVLITSKKGAVRANHYHKKDIHYVYVIKGSMQYTYKDINNKTGKKRTIIVKAGEVVTSPPLTIHAMKFLEDSVFLALTTEPRDSRRYEKDTVRVKLIATE